MLTDSCDRRLHESWVLRKLILLVVCVQANMRTKCIVGRNSYSGSARFHMSFYYLRVSTKASSYSYRKKSCRWTHDVPVQAQRGGGGVAPTHSHPRYKKWMGGQHHVPAALPQGKNRHTLCRKLGGPRGLFGGVQKIAPLSGTKARTVQPVSCRHTEYAILAFFQKQVLRWAPLIQQ